MDLTGSRERMGLGSRDLSMNDAPMALRASMTVGGVKDVASIVLAPPQLATDM